MNTFLVVLGCAVVGIGLMWVEQSVLGRDKLSRFVEKRGYVLRRARWRPSVGFRQGRFEVELERQGRVTHGRAYVGGFFTGPVFSSRVTFDFDDDRVPDL